MILIKIGVKIMGYNTDLNNTEEESYRRAKENLKRIEDNYWYNKIHYGVRLSNKSKHETEKHNPSSTVRNGLNAVVIGNLISAHYEGDSKKFDAYANFIAEAYEQRGDLRGAKIIRNRMDGSYKNNSTISLEVSLDEADEQRDGQ